MNADASAYASLGLQPGADRKAIEAAYKRLIKKHHPDRNGGNPERAAEINRAYQYLRASPRRAAGPSKPVVTPAATARPGRRRRWTPVAIVGTAVLTLVVTLGAIRNEVRGLPSAVPVLSRSAAVEAGYVPGRNTSIDSPLDGDGIDRAIASALDLTRGGDGAGLAAQSRRCHAQLRRNPDASRLDQCVAFDEAVVALMQRDLLEDAGPFSTSAVMARQINAARMLSDDSLAIDSRLGQIRSRVEFTLAPPQEPMTPPAAVLER